MSFAVISIVILISASVTAAYVYTLTQKEIKAPNLPVTGFENLRQDIYIDMKNMAIDSLRTALSVYRNVLESETSNISISNTLDSYCENATSFFEERFQEKYPGTVIYDNFEVSAVIIRSGNRSYMVHPTYTNLYTQTELGADPQLVSNGFVLNASVEMNVVDTNTQARFQDLIAVYANISTEMPMVLQLMTSVDLSNLENILSSMAGAVLFARLYGTWSQDMGANLSGMPKPNRTLSEPAFDNGEAHAIGFRSDIGPVPYGTLMSKTDFDIIRDLAFILVQIRYFGTWDEDFVTKFLGKVHAYSISDEGKHLMIPDLRTMIGETSPNFVNCEALVLELFHRMGQVPTNINIVLPLLKKMMDQGFMSLFDAEWDTWMKEHLSFPEMDPKNMFKSGGWFDSSWLLKDPFLLVSYGLVLEEFMSLILGYILRAYHIDRANEIKDFVSRVINQNMEDKVLKNVPGKIEIPPGKPVITIDLKGAVRKSISKGLDIILGSLYPTKIMGIEFNGYTWVYLFMMTYDRPEYNETLLQAKYDEVYGNWTSRVKAFIKESNISALTAVVNGTASAFEAKRKEETKILNDFSKIDLSSNKTLNQSLQKALSVLQKVSKNYTQASPLMNGSRPFFIYTEGGETQDWKDLDQIQRNSYTIMPEMNSVFDEFDNYASTMNISSKWYDAVINISVALRIADDGLYATYDLFDQQLDNKWKRDVLVEVKAKIDGLTAADMSAGTLYSCIGLLSETLSPHPKMGFNGSIDDVAEDIANISSETKGLTFKNNGTKLDLSVRDILKEDRGIQGIIRLLEQNIKDIRTTFVGTVAYETNVDLIKDRPTWISHRTLELASVRLLNGSYAESMSDLLMKKASLSAEEKRYSDITPIMLWENKSSFSIYGEKSYLDLEISVLDALIKKLADLQEIFEATEVHPGLAATFGGVHKDGPGGPSPLSNISLTYGQTSSSIKWSGLRVFENTSSVAPEDLFLQYLNPFSENWHDYYLTCLLFEGEGRLNTTLRFIDMIGPMADVGTVTMEARVDYGVNYSMTVSSPTPLPATNIHYSPTAPFFKRLTSVELDRNVFSNTCNKAHVNFTYEGAGGNFKNDMFEVQVKAIVRAISSSFVLGIATAVQAFMSGNGQDAGVERDLTGVIEVADNDKKDLDPRSGHISVEVTIDLARLRTRLGDYTLFDSTPILQVMVWKASTFKALISETLLESVAGEGNLYCMAPTIQLNEQGFFYFDKTEDPVLGVYDVGGGDKEVKVPLEIFLEDLTSVPLMAVDIGKLKNGDLSGFVFSRDDPRVASVYNLTCMFTIIRKIPSDSVVVFNKNVPLLVDFDDGHQWLRDMHMNLLMVQKRLGEFEEAVLNGLLPRSVVEKQYVLELPPSEYKFALTYNFMPVYMQYFNGYQPQATMAEVQKGKNFVIPMGQSDNPDLVHIAYRVVPMNINRGKLALTLWYQLMSELVDANYTLDFFVYDIIGTAFKEINDILDMAQFGLKNFGSFEKLTETLEIMKILQKAFGYWKNIEEIIKLINKTVRPGLFRLSTPGAKDGLDWGNNYYLGFDIGTNWTHDEARSQGLKLTAMMMGLGFWYDVKNLLKMIKDLIKFTGFFQGSGEVDSKALMESMKKMVNSVDTYTSLATKFNKMLNPSGGKSSNQFIPAPLFMIQKKFNMTDEQLKENGVVARKLGYSIVDVSILRHRNGFNLDELTKIHDGFGVDQYGAHALTCIVDLNSTTVTSILMDKSVIKFGYSKICNYGKKAKFSDWRTIFDVIDSGVPWEAVNISAKISLPYNLLLKCQELSIDPVDLARKAEALVTVFGHENLFKYLGKNPDRLELIDAAYEFKKVASLFILPGLTLDLLWTIGPDIYFKGRLIYVYSLPSGASTAKDVKVFVDHAQRDALNRTDKTCYIFLDIRFSKTMTDNKFIDAFLDRPYDIDKTGRIRYQFIYDGSNGITTYLRDARGLTPIPYIPNDL